MHPDCNTYTNGGREALIKTIPYEYQNAPIPGGGYVTGFLYHPQKENILYARTDIGGTYRYDADRKKWDSLINHVTGEELAATYPIALAVDPVEEKKLYIACGVYAEPFGKLLISNDGGESFVEKPLPVFVHGNLSGRGTGYRLVVDPTDTKVLYFASQKDGLIRSMDGGENWERLPIEEGYMTFVWVAPNGTTIVAGTAGYTTRISDQMRSHSLYVSYDRGESFAKLDMPESVLVADAKMSGLVAQRYAFDGKYFYATLASTGRWNYIVDLGYSCDTGDTICGKVVRYPYLDGKLGNYELITPMEGDETPGQELEYGFGGIDVAASKPGVVAVSSLCKEKGGAESLYLSTDYGTTWKTVMRGLEVGRMNFRTSYMLPKYNGNRSLLHWLSDVKINPFCENELWFNSGTGVFTTKNLLAETVEFSDWCDGIEETVHLNVYGPLKGELQLLDVVGDLGSFAFYDLKKPCDNSMADQDNNRYITCINADLSDTDETIGVITARGNWTGKTKGGLLYTKNQFHSVERIPMPFGINAEIDEALSGIERPNVNPGWVAMSENGCNIIWSVADGIRLPKEKVIVSTDGGKTFTKVKLSEVEGAYFKAFSDSVNSSLFYGFDELGMIYISKDGGKQFKKASKVVAHSAAGETLMQPRNDFGLIDTANKTEVRRVAGKQGVFYLALAKNGLWRMEYDGANDRVDLKRLSQPGDAVLRMGLGIGKQDAAFSDENKGIYFAGTVNGVYGFYRSFDEMETIERINTSKQMYGEINSIDADKRVRGRCFLATGSRGVLYGEER